MYYYYLTIEPIAIFIYFQFIIFRCRDFLMKSISRNPFFGDQYNNLKLISIRDKYDPSSLFVVASGLGSERWDKELICRQS